MASQRLMNVLLARHLSLTVTLPIPTKHRRW